MLSIAVAWRNEIDASRYAFDTRSIRACRLLDRTWNDEYESRAINDSTIGGIQSLRFAHRLRHLTVFPRTALDKFHS